MSTLSTTYTFSAGNLIKSAEVNQNFTDIVSWGNGNIQQDNIGTLSGTITWAVTSNTLAQSISNSGTQGSISLTYTGVLAASKAPLRISNSTAQTAGDAAVFYGESTNVSSSIAAVKISNSGTGPVLDLTSTTSGALLPRMTTAQRTALTAVEGLEIWNTTLKRKEVYNGSFWIAAAGNSGEIVCWPGASIPAYMVLCDGSTLAVNATNAYAISVLGSTWGASGQLPNQQRKSIIGSGGTAIAGPANTLGSTGGHENLQSHTHTQNAHNHSITDPGHTHDNPTTALSLTAGGNNTPNNTDNADPNVATFSATTGISINNATATNQNTGAGNAENMPPCNVMHICMVL
jgi:hypothetical protein